jgi:hypothetical protein
MSEENLGNHNQFREKIVEIIDHLERAILDYSQSQSYDNLVQAKNDYFGLTGKLNEESDEFESKMNCFNDWFLFNYKGNADDSLALTYAKDKGLGEDIIATFSNMNFSVFEYQKCNERKRTATLKDLFTKESFIIDLDNFNAGVVENDIFMARALKFQKENFLLKGICVLPSEIKSVLAKEIKKLTKKMKGTKKEPAPTDPKEIVAMKENFLFNLENMRTRWISFGKMKSQKIFNFANPTSPIHN